MRALLKQHNAVAAGQRALDRGALHEPDDGRVVLAHLKGDSQAFGAPVDRCVGRLPTHHRAVFVLRELEGKSYAEIAEITGCNLGTVKSRLNRARNSFAQLIEPLLE